MSEKKFRSLSMRVTLIQEVSDFIKEHPDFTLHNPEFNSIAGFVDQAVRATLKRLKKTVLVA